MGNIVGDVTTVVIESVDWVGQFVGAITANPLILLFVIVAFVGLGVGLLSRLMHL